MSHNNIEKYFKYKLKYLDLKNNLEGGENMNDLINDKYEIIQYLDKVSEYIESLENKNKKNISEDDLNTNFLANMINTKDKEKLTKLLELNNIINNHKVYIESILKNL